MESAFIFGAVFGVGLRMTVARVVRKPFLYSTYFSI